MTTPNLNNPTTPQIILPTNIAAMVYELRDKFESLHQFILSHPELDAKTAYQQIRPAVLSSWEPFKQALETLTQEEGTHFGSAIRDILHPYMLQSPFMHRCFTKPLGYAGDYKMVDMMFGDGVEGDTLFAQVLNLIFLNETHSVLAHRGRIDTLREILLDTASKAQNHHRQFRILNIGCGPAHEIQQFIKESDLTEHLDITLIDFNAETLAYAQEQLLLTQAQQAKTLKTQYIQQSVYDMIKQAVRPTSVIAGGNYDLIYCAGLYDYLTDKVCQRLNALFLNSLRPGGELVITNVAAHCTSNMTGMITLDWPLIVRSHAELLALVPENCPPTTEIKQYAEKTDGNLFLSIQIPAPTPQNMPA